MITLDKAYNAQKYEDSIYRKWEESGAFTPQVDSEKNAFTISMPPPNATGTLHLGHAVMLAIEDIMIRHKRMQGFEALWLPGTDHAAIATQSVVEKKLEREGIANPRSTLGREKLLGEIRDFVAKSKNTIRNQIRKMGASCDWTREKYTLDDDLNHSVNTFFGRMYGEGLIYHGDRIVNWDPKMQTTVADDELEYREEKAKFYYFQYGPVVIGTARPETKFADKVIIVHPDDKRYKHLHNREFELEWMEGPIKAKVIADTCVDPGVGTGAMTITPAHSFVDFELAEKYKLQKEQIIDFNGNLKEVAGEFAGMNILEAREKIVEKMKAKGLLVKIDEDYVHNIAVNYRGKGVVEPQIMKQWFIDVNKKAIDWKGQKMSIKEVLQDTVLSEMIRIIPARFEKTYFHWIDNLRDWCISRQIWWGHQIPVWFRVSKKDREIWAGHPESSSYLLQSLNISILETKFSETMPEKGDWIRDPDTLDTWFSSAMWTFSTLGWPEKSAELDYFHPTNVMETGYDILFFWIARMILASTYCLRSDGLPEKECIPFKEVYLHGLIRDIHGKKMSKSRPETCIDPLEMIDKYGTDAVRLSLVIGSTPGNDMRLYEEKIGGYRNFVNKIWNASRFALMNIDEKDISEELTPDKIKTLADKWILTRLNKLIKEVDKDLDKYRFSTAATRIYNFTWGDYCDWYLEVSKADHTKNPVVLLHVLKTILRLLHPFIPFVTEEIWSHLREKNLLIKSSWPSAEKKFNFPSETMEMEAVIAVISEIRRLRADHKVEPAKKIHAIIYGASHTKTLEIEKESIMRLSRLEKLEICEKGKKVAGAVSAICQGTEVHLPLKDMIDIAKEENRLSKEIETAITQLASLKARLANKQFTSKAPKEVTAKAREQLKEVSSHLAKLKKQKEEL